MEISGVIASAVISPSNLKVEQAKEKLMNKIRIIFKLFVLIISEWKMTHNYPAFKWRRVFGFCVSNQINYLAESLKLRSHYPSPICRWSPWGIACYVKTDPRSADSKCGNSNGLAQPLNCPRPHRLNRNHGVGFWKQSPERCGNSIKCRKTQRPNKPNRPHLRRDLELCIFSLALNKHQISAWGCLWQILKKSSVDRLTPIYDKSLRSASWRRGAFT